MTDREIRDRLDEIAGMVEVSAQGLFRVTASEFGSHEGGLYRLLTAKPTKRLAAALNIDRELLVLVTTFTDLQARTTKVLRRTIDKSAGRLESSVAVIVHCDPDGHLKLKNWGQEGSLSILPVFAGETLPKGDDFERLLCHEMYTYDPFDVTGPVSTDANFFGRRETAQDLARALQHGQIRSTLGIRKIGKTSLINRVVSDMQRNHKCHCIMLDCSRDDIWTLNAAGLLHSIAVAIMQACRDNAPYAAVVGKSCQEGVAISAQSLGDAVLAADHPVIVVFDEVDYVTPGSPTSETWREQFNVFWRNLRSIHQECARTGKTLSLFICGVSGKWFSVESIDGIENAALAMVPEEYLSPLPRDATIAMIKRIGRVAGLQFDNSTASLIASTCADMPFWVRKAGSFIHRRVPSSERPVIVSPDRVEALLEEFLAADGATLALVALRHLFRVFPDIGAAAQLVLDHVEPSSQRIAQRLHSYGICDESCKAFAGEMMRRGCENYFAEKEQEIVEPTAVATLSTLDEWAEELAVINARRNKLEKRLRTIVTNFVRQDFLKSNRDKSVVDRVLATVPSEQRKRFAGLTAEEAIERLMWKQLVELIALKEWGLFESLFGEKKVFLDRCDRINDRFDAHAKDADEADLALYRRDLSALEEAIRPVL